MKWKRREFMKKLAGGALAASCAPPAAVFPVAQWESKAPADPYGCLVDLSVCIGCRKCEQGCALANELPTPSRSYDDVRVLDQKHRPDANTYTVINRYFSGLKYDKLNRLVPTYVKSQCMHCQDPACVSVCLSGALQKMGNGAVYYDKSRCVGCRYCMMACPFQIPAYEYADPLTPRVRKCTFCFELISQGGKPACAAICPMETMTFGKRNDLLVLAQKRIAENPRRYVDHIYGQHEVGGTSWMYISDVPFEKVDFVQLPSDPPPRLPETLQHTLFKYLWSPILFFFSLAGVTFLAKRTRSEEYAPKTVKEIPK